MYEYSICNEADDILFFKQCAAIEKYIPNLYKRPILEDVDGTLVQKYTCGNGNIIVKNDRQVDALYIVSDFGLPPFFNCGSKGEAKYE